MLYADTDGNTSTIEFMLTLDNFTGWSPAHDTAAEGAPTGVIL